MDPVVLLLVGVVLVAVVVVVVARRRTGDRSAGADVARRGGDLEGGLVESRRTFTEALRSVLGRPQIDAAFWEGLEEALMAVDVGVDAAARIVGRVRAANPETPEAARALLHREMLDILSGRSRRLDLGEPPAVILVVGVNGTGKTTSIAKLAARLEREDTTTLLAAADTFRAGAAAQLRSWGERVGVDVVAGAEASDPAAVAFDAYRAAKARGRGAVIIDTAGRLHSKANLMAELEKVHRVLQREAGRVSEVLLVLDSTGGQNGIAQARQFLEAVGVTGIVLTKLDGTARGGIVMAIEEELGIPVKLVGVGEGLDDLVPFEPERFVNGLLEGS